MTSSVYAFALNSSITGLLNRLQQILARLPSEEVSDEEKNIRRLYMTRLTKIMSIIIYGNGVRLSDSFSQENVLNNYTQTTTDMFDKLLLELRTKYANVTDEWTQVVCDENSEYIKLMRGLICRPYSILLSAVHSYIAIYWKSVLLPKITIDWLNKLKEKKRFYIKIEGGGRKIQSIHLDNISISLSMQGTSMMDDQLLSTLNFHTDRGDNKTRSQDGIKSGPIRMKRVRNTSKDSIYDHIPNFKKAKKKKEHVPNSIKLIDNDKHILEDTTDYTLYENLKKGFKYPMVLDDKIIREGSQYTNISDMGKIKYFTSAYHNFISRSRLFNKDTAKADFGNLYHSYLVEYGKIIDNRIDKLDNEMCKDNVSTVLWNEPTLSQNFFYDHLGEQSHLFLKAGLHNVETSETKSNNFNVNMLNIYNNIDVKSVSDSNTWSAGSILLIHNNHILTSTTKDEASGCYMDFLNPIKFMKSFSPLCDNRYLFMDSFSKDGTTPYKNMVEGNLQNHLPIPEFDIYNDSLREASDFTPGKDNHRSFYVYKAAENNVYVTECFKALSHYFSPNYKSILSDILKWEPNYSIIQDSFYPTIEYEPIMTADNYIESMDKELSKYDHVPGLTAKKDSVINLNDIQILLTNESSADSIPIDVDFNVDHIISELQSMTPLQVLLAKLPLSIKGSINLEMSFNQ